MNNKRVVYIIKTNDENRQYVKTVSPDEHSAGLTNDNYGAYGAVFFTNNIFAALQFPNIEMAYRAIKGTYEKLMTSDNTGYLLNFPTEYRPMKLEITFTEEEVLTAV